MKTGKFKLWILAAGMIFLFVAASGAASDFDKENGMKQNKFGDSFSRTNSNEFQGSLRGDGGDNEDPFKDPNKDGAEEIGKRNGSVGDAIGLILGLGLIYGVYAGKRQYAVHKAR
ncbi:MAG: hypothetical protein LBB41_07890 [Prevotellaceae bacterium]|jgi:hypothetical protein|nr:hypothetical protein [Prevotellaceae bacterium]